MQKLTPIGNVMAAATLLTSLTACNIDIFDDHSSSDNPPDKPSSDDSGAPSGSQASVNGDGPFIVVDQFGYPTDARKVAVVRDPVEGFDSADAYTPGVHFELVDADTSTVVFRSTLQPWHDGAVDPSSGDKTWRFDFSSIQTPGNYYVRDLEAEVVSPTFSIDDAVYDDVLKQAMRAMFYQRVGFAKQEPYAEPGWTDAASHLGTGQDPQARLFSDPDNAATERDLRGGWFDAGDFNKYTNWTAAYVVDLLHAYLENPAAWGDDFNIPESGNGIPDILDEAKWGMDSLIRLQNDNGSVLSIVGLAHASPPSSATGASLYGPESTSATLSTASAFALGAKVFGDINQQSYKDYAGDLLVRAKNAWDWADANPSVVFYNNDSANGSSGLGAGQQEVDDKGRLLKKLHASAYLFEMTGDVVYQDFFDSNYRNADLIAYYWSNPFAVFDTHILLYYANLPNATASVANVIKERFVNAMNSDSHLWGAVNDDTDPYQAQLKDYTWGSSGVKSDVGFMFYEQILQGLNTQSEAEVKNVALGYLHYLHGVNPLGKVYLSNMGNYGAENSVDQFYHSWFSDGSAKWDSVSDSLYGPPPGFLVGGANPSYDWDSCCPYSCGSPENNAKCGVQQLSPPYGQPNQKSYTDFNDSWPLNSWSVTENSNGYQIRYLRLLSKFVH
ncbi:glycoside hydrolase family 9 protein [Gynuella sp.]|uniref:glycoside hydrolase family 9 protein n=1 Tax=Gynuella sp. TaxID=2969146 RepID=UPI003D12AFE1